ncbi:MAG: YfhO family protein [Anaerolineae bacterium]|nr:YfhO family protein [Anaerolineae bacterium]MDW8173953.1 YfhO family protein [Anaerolineae bacterium]
MAASRLVRRAWPALAGLAFVVVLCAQLIFTDRIFGRGDTLNYFYPLWQARDEALAEGRLPLWTPYLFMGAPLLANPQLGTFYPPNWLTLGLDPPNAVRWSAVFHLVWGGLGAAWLYGRWFGSARWGALAAALLWMGGGYAIGRMESINQLQGLAWLPWLIGLWHEALNTTGAVRLAYGLLLSAALAWQVFSGHTQTTFIGGAGLGLLALAHALAQLEGESRARLAFYGLLILVLAALLALLLATPQLLPTLELSGLSARGGGLNAQQATAFSLPLRYAPYALLPLGGGYLFTEYSAYLGVLGLGLALLGALCGGRRAWPWAALALIGLAFAFGRYNPLYLLIAELPGFDLFRVPSRWLALLALSGAILGGRGLQILAERTERQVVWLIGAGLAGLILLARFAIAPDSADVVGQSTPDVLAWGMALAAWLSLGLLRRGRATLVGAALATELLLASRAMPLNHLTPPEAYDGQRFTISHLLAEQADALTPPRLLSISPLLFELGDQAALEARYARLGLNSLSARYSLVAAKRQELLFPNLPLTWSIPSVDGFDGGVLPTTYYSQFTALALPPGVLRLTDGRLGEWLALESCRGACWPEPRMLDMMGVGHLLMDKVYDVWHEDVAYDTGLWQLARGAWSVPYSYEATEVHLLLSSGVAPPQIVVEWQDASQAVDLSEQKPIINGGETLMLARYALPEPRVVQGVQAQAGGLLAVSLLDARDSTFVQLVPQGWTRSLSSDVKLYSRDVPRAWWVSDSIYISSDTWLGSEDSLSRMASPGFDPLKHATLQAQGAPTVLRQGASPDSTGQASIAWQDYQAESLRLRVEADAPGLLVLSESYFPGWQAEVNGAAWPILRANVALRALALPPGAHDVSLRYDPPLYHLAFGLGALAWLSWIAACATLALRLRTTEHSPKT